MWTGIAIAYLVVAALHVPLFFQLVRAAQIATVRAVVQALINSAIWLPLWAAALVRRLRWTLPRLTGAVRGLLAGRVAS